MLDHIEWTNPRVVAQRAKGRSHLPSKLTVPMSWRLTAAEVRVVHYLASGLTPARIAYSLGRSLHTIRTHLKHAIAKAGVNTQVALVARLYSASESKPCPSPTSSKTHEAAR
jgi:DNA-binding CsgD family transcriptional regulator